jgi:hypothetical protein
MEVRDVIFFILFTNYDFTFNYLIRVDSVSHP